MLGALLLVIVLVAVAVYYLAFNKNVFSRPMSSSHAASSSCASVFSSVWMLGLAALAAVTAFFLFLRNAMCVYHPPCDGEVADPCTGLTPKEAFDYSVRMTSLAGAVFTFIAGAILIFATYSVMSGSTSKEGYEMTSSNSSSSSGEGELDLPMPPSGDLDVKTLAPVADDSSEAILAASRMIPAAEPVSGMSAVSSSAPPAPAPYFAGSVIRSSRIPRPTMMSPERITTSGV
jgi:hypothetical protein